MFRKSISEISMYNQNTYKCPKCETEQSILDTINFLDEKYCKVCFKKFLGQHVPTLETFKNINEKIKKIK